jgi:acyl-CoA hydrolase
MTRAIDPSDWPSLLCPGETVYWPGCSGESPLLWEALAASPGAAAGVTFTGMWIPTLNRHDPAALTPTTRARAYFAVPEQRASFEAGRIDLLPLTYWQSYRHLAEVATIDTAVLHLSPPDAQGLCSLGVAADFTPAVWRKAKRRIAHLNPNMPRTQAPAIHISELDRVIEAPGPLLQAPTPAVTPDIAAIASHIAALIPNGATLQFGLGNVQRGVLEALAGREGLAIHSGMVSDPVLALSPDTRITTGVAVGTDPLYAWAASAPHLRFAPVGFTHDQATLRAIPQLIAINSIIEIDLFAQANAEVMNGKLVSSPGGLTDFLRGARASPGGKAIVALRASAKDGAVSRIVPELAQRLVSIGRADIDWVVTEQGAVSLAGLGLEARAAALISLAHPHQQPMLKEAWTVARRSL